MKTIILLFTLYALQLNAQFTIYTPENSPLEDVFINDVVVDLDNRVWVTTDSNIYMIKNEEWNVYDYNNTNLPNQIARRVYLDDKGDIWFLFDNAIAKYKEGEFIIIDSTMGGYTFAIDYNQNIWLSRNEQLFVKRNGIWQKAFKTELIPKLWTYEIIVDKNNDVWFDRPEFGFRKVDGDSSKLIVNPEIALEDQDYWRIKLDSNDNIWAASLGDIVEYNPTKEIWKSYKSNFQNTSFKMTQIITFAFDENNNCFMGGVLDPKGLSIVLFANLTHDYVNIFNVEAKNKETNETITPKYFRAMATDFDGNIWFGALYKGIGKFDSKLLSVQKIPNSDYSIYPNPTTSSLSIELENEALATSYKITDTKGKQVLTGSLSPSSLVSIDLEQLPVGVYLIEITTSSGEVVIDKFVKE